VQKLYPEIIARSHVVPRDPRACERFIESVYRALGEKGTLIRVVAKDVVLVAAWTFATTQAANQKYRNTSRNQHGKKILVRHEPMKKSMHDGDTCPLSPKLPDPRNKLDAMHAHSALRSTGTPAR
jgi:hypothetical protein